MYIYIYIHVFTWKLQHVKETFHLCVIFCWHANWCEKQLPVWYNMQMYSNVQCETFTLNSNFWSSDPVRCLVTFPIDEYPLHHREYTPAVPFQGTGLLFSVSPWARDVPMWMSTWNLRRFGRVGDVSVPISEKVVPCHHTAPSNIVSISDLLIFATIVGGGLQGQAAWIYKKAI